jgi:SAM-dependent methyltransferase
MQGRGRLPRGTTLLAPCLAPLASARSAASRPAQEVNFGEPSARGLSVSAPLPVPDGARLLVSVGAGTAILPRVRARAAAPGGEPYEQLGPLYDRWCAGVDHDVAFYVLACEDAAGPIIELGAGSGRIAVELARHGHRVIALDAAPAMLAQANRRASRFGVEDLLETVVGDLRDPPPLPLSDRVLAPFRTFMHLSGDDERRRALTAAGSLLAEGGQFIFDVFEPSAADIRATHDRWIPRSEGISEHPLWAADERRLDLDVRLPGRVVSMTLEWRSAAEWQALCSEAGLAVHAAQSGFDGAPLTGQTGDHVFVCGRV